MRSELTERPVERSTEDLLGMTPHAERLAELLASALLAPAALPVTVGIYGPWGAGKTSFANLLVNELRRLPDWAELRLIRFSAWPYTTPTAIWQALVERIAREVYSQENASRPPAGVQTAMTTPNWKEKLRGALLADALTLRPGTADPQRESYQNLVQRLSGSAGIASRTPSPQLGGLTLGAFASLVLAAAATISAPLGPVSQLFSANTASGSGPQELTALESIEQIRTDLREVFTRAGGTRNVVLIDDLDRCHPEIALDVLETIKIFFAESEETDSHWLFLVPADERLIGNGLRVRFGQLDHAEAIDARSYMEKIIQVGVTLPEITVDGAHSLVADNTPEWAGASDLIISALDGNPRRIKQQGVLLSYRYPDEPDGFVLSLSDANALAKLVRYHCLQEDYATDPDLDAVNAESLRTLASIADLRPGSDGISQTRDPVFSYVSKLMTDQDGTTTPRRLAVSYLSRLLQVREAVPTLFDQIVTWSADYRSRYTSLIGTLDSWIDAHLGDKPVEASDDIRATAESVGPLLKDEKVRDALTKEPRLSSIPGSYVQLAAGDTIVPPTDFDVAGVIGDRFQAGALRIADEHPEEIASLPSTLRLQVAKDIIDRRKYVKVELLLTRWPELIQFSRGRGGARRLRDLEAAVVRGDQDVSLPESWKQLTADEHLREFLQLPPSLAQTYGEEISSIAGASGAVPSGAQVPSAMPDTVSAYRNLDLVASTTTDSADVPSLEVTSGEIAGVASAVTALPSGRRVEGQIILSIGDQPGRIGEARANVLVPVEEIMRLTAELFRAEASQTGNPRRIGSLPVSDILADIGMRLWSSTIGSNAELEAMFMWAFDTSQRLRICVVSANDQLTALPWECLFIPRHRVFAGQTLKLSVVRKIADPARLASPRPGSPLRVLIAEASPRDLAILGAEQEIGLIRKSLEPATAAGLARVEEVRQATRDSVWHAIQSFRPHVFHFLGHAGFDQQEGRGVIILADEDGKHDFVGASDIGLLMQDYGILLAVLNGCETSWPDLTDRTLGVSQTIVRQGVPAAIGTIRAVSDNAALRFAGEFYKSIADGLPVEPALVEARRGLALKGWDWSTYAMYANPEFPLHTIRVQRNVG